MMNDITILQDTTLAEIAAATTVEGLDAIRQNVLGRKAGTLTAILKTMKDLSSDQKRELGPVANAARVSIEAALDEALAALKASQESASLDITLPGIVPSRGTLHPMTIVTNELVAIFQEMGFMVQEGPELESEVYNFDVLNIPKTHPARDIQDTFFVQTQIDRGIETGEKRELADSAWVMRTHTSNMQVRVMEEMGTPVRCVIPGRVFRNEATDATHDHTFYQLEGFVADKNISIGNLLWFLTEVLKAFYQKDITLRLRPGYFPFVEPGYEVDMSCMFCDQKGCGVCKKTGWIELGGSGMIHPHVFTSAGVDPETHTGFAFGLGISRIAMLKYGIDDIRRMHHNDLSFLKQFS